jgi:DNA-binding response OmpR family regulator
MNANMNAKKKILIVDDEDINREFFEVMLSKLGFVVEKAGDGKEALEKVRLFFPDLILLDNVMPKMSGWEFTRIMKADPELRSIPIVMFSALDDVKNKVEGFELGVDDYIIKPFNFSEVLARIRVVLRNRELFAQVALRDARLKLARELGLYIKDGIADFVSRLDALDAAVAVVCQGKGGAIQEKALSVRKGIAEIDARLERTILEWEDLKTGEIGLADLETQNRTRQE